MSEPQTLTTESPTDLEGKLNGVLEICDEKLQVEAIAQLVEQLDYRDGLQQWLGRRLGNLNANDRKQRSELTAAQSEIRELVMDVALLKRAVSALGQIGVLERRRVEKELILDLFPPTQPRDGAGVRVAPPKGSPVTMDCESRRPLCKASCCRIFQVNLTADEIQSDRYEWNPKTPYSLIRNRLGCTYLRSHDCVCTLHDARPATCARYSCRQDRRIWVDFDKRILNVDLAKRLEALPVSPSGTAAASPPASPAQAPGGPPWPASSDLSDVGPPDFGTLREMIVPEPTNKFVPPRDPPADSDSEHSVNGDSDPSADGDGHVDPNDP